MSSPTSSQLLATAPASPAQGGFLEDMLGFTESLLPIPKETVLFNPAAPLSSEVESNSDDGTTFFKRTAMSKADDDRYVLPRTRSQSKSVDTARSTPVPSTSSNKAVAAPATKGTKGGFSKGDVVYAHKGKVVPCWFPGVVSVKGKKGTYKVKFFADFGMEDCVTSNIMMYSEFTTRKEEGADKKLFEVPKKISLNFKEAQQQAETSVSKTSD